MRTFLVAAGLASLGVAGAAHAADTSYVAKTITESSSRGLPVKPPLDDLLAVSRVRFLVPQAWKAKGTTQFETVNNPSCRYRVKFTVRTRIDDPGDASARVKAAVPGSRAFVLDEGQRNADAFRVVRRSKSGGVHLDGQWSGVMTRRTDIVPQGKVAWTDLSVAADSTEGSECHSGTYREVLGPQLGDALATTRNQLKFVKKT